MASKLIIKPGREKPLFRQHPWIFSGAIQRIIGEPQSGDLVRVISSKGDTLGYGGFSPNSQIRCRMWDFATDIPKELETEFPRFLENRIDLAVKARETNPLLNETNAFRLVHAESDRLPGLIVDKYADGLVVQFLSTGIDIWRKLVIKFLIKRCSPSFIFERSDAEVRKLEGLPGINKLLYGKLPPDGVVVIENGLKIKINVQSGQKTGFYLDQRENRKALRVFTAEKDVLDCFCYTGGFTLNALLGGAKSVTAVDQSDDSLSLLDQNLKLNRFDQNKVELIKEDVFQILRKFRDRGNSWDVIILDPPKFAPTKRQAQKAARGYKDINLIAAKLLNPGGYLFTFSCSGGIDGNLFQQIVAGAAADAEIDLKIIQRMGQGSDHPILLNFPEGEYLKGLVCRKGY